MSSPEPPGAGEAGKIQILKDALYDAMTSRAREDHPFTQKELLELNVIPEENTSLLLQVVQGLSNEMLLKPVNDGSVGLAWCYRKVEDAEKYKYLTQDQRLVYEQIDNSGNDGIWTRTIKHRLRIHESVFNACIKQLESKGYIRDIKSVENPNKKIYIKANTKPSDKTTGKAWHTDGELDEAMVDMMSAVVYHVIRDRSTERVGGERLKGGKHARAKLVGFPAGYTAYPTVEDITHLIEDKGIVAGDSLGTNDIQEVLDVLIWDGLIEKIRNHGDGDGSIGYRVKRISAIDPNVTVNDDIQKVKTGGDLGPLPRSNGMTEIPCGACPNFDICEPGGPVNPDSCVYFKEWLDLDF